ncbi:MAG: hypothetical protein G8345_07770 [Magnetococcales bacterium]|nr:hypothetical protein [Magnetococcales bacterium]NGZ26773.1 hypothetical protein [Magnetococcales bacterium]
MIISARLQQKEGMGYWQGEVVLSNPADFQRLTLGDDLQLQLGEEMFVLKVLGKSLQRNPTEAPQWKVAIGSPAVLLTAPWSLPIRQSWSQSLGVKEVVESLVGGEVTWNLVQWKLPWFGVEAQEKFPLEIIQELVGQAGGVVESLPEGQLLVRHRFPLPVPHWSRGEADHVLSDEWDNLAVRESLYLNTPVVRVAVQGEKVTGAGLRVEVDARPEGLNQGKTSFAKGETVHLLVFVDAGVTQVTLQSSLGTLLPGANQVITWTEEVSFRTSHRGQLTRPARVIKESTWLGNDLGEITLLGDGVTLLAEESGVAVARVVYECEALSWSLLLPTDGPVVDIHSVQVVASGLFVGREGAYLAQRGVGGPLQEVFAPLLTTPTAKRARAMAELDGGEWFDQVLLTCRHRPGLLPGQLVEVRSSYLTETWRGKIIQVVHEAEGSRCISHLTLLRHRPRGAPIPWPPARPFSVHVP